MITFFLTVHADDKKERGTPVPTCTISITPKELLEGKPFSAKYKGIVDNRSSKVKKTKSYDKKESRQDEVSQVISIEMGWCYYVKFESFLNQCKFAGAQIEWIKSDGWASKTFTIKGNSKDLAIIVDAWQHRKDNAHER